MNSEWKIFTVGELIKNGIIERPMDGNHGSIHPVGTDFVEAGIPFVMASDLKNNQIVFNECKYISEEQAKSLKKGFSREGDVLLTHKATIGRTALVDKLSYPFIILSPQVTYYRVANNNKLNNRYLKYYFDNSYFQELLKSWSGSGSTRSYLGITAQHKLPIMLPSINEQQRIVSILSSLDDKIELNRQICKTLEDIAATLFKSWFIDFDPVKAKAAGRKPEGLSPEIADLFPDAFTTNELPSGWHFTVAYDWAEYINGAAYKDSHFTEAINGLPIIKIAELKSGISSSTKYSNVNLGDKYKIDTGNILLSWSGSPETSIDTFLWVNGPGWLNQHIFNVIPKAPESRTFVYFLLKYLKQTLINIAKNKQTTGLGHITVKDLKELKVVNPSSKLIKSFDLIVAPILQRIQQTMEENVCLSRTRNNLLPKLISGEIQL